MALPVVYMMMMIALLVFLLRQRRATKNLPPSPPTIPIFGNLHQLGPLPHRSLAALCANHGPLTLLHLGNVPTLVASSASVARDITKTHDQIFASRPSFKIADTVLYGSTGMSFAPYGEHWRNVRKLCVAHLLNSKTVHSFRHIREEEVALMVRKISSAAAAGAAGVVDMSSVLNTFTNDHLCKVVSGKFDSEMRNEELNGLKGELSALFGAFHVGDYIPYMRWIDVLSGLDGRGKKNRRGWDVFLDQVIEEHADRKRGRGYVDEDVDFVDVLLSLQKDSSLGFQLTTDNIKALLVEMFFAGTDTSYIALEWAMSELVRNPEVMKKLQDQIRKIMGGKNLQVQEADLENMIYLKCVLKEVLRLHPSTPLLLHRESMKDCEIQGYVIPNKTRVIINAWAVNRDPEFWEAPDEFRPERFVGNSTDFMGNDFQFIPFGAGRRICPGITFAMASIELALANLVNQFEWELPKGLTRENFDMTEAPGITIHRKHKLELLVKPHSG